MKYLRLLLFPVSLIYGLVIIIRNWFYNAGIFKSYQFDLPVICVGNLEVGGAGKSPMTEYLIRLFQNDYQLATLSRGYGRDTTGYILADTTATASQVGDEPAQFKHKFPDVDVAVCEKRADGIKQLLPAHNLIILDDAYQHRAVKPGFSILLFDYKNISQLQLMLPAGNLREPFAGRWRADILVVSKCPESLSAEQQSILEKHAKPLPYQQLFYTSIVYQPLQNRSGTLSGEVIDSDTAVFLLTGIANPAPLLQHLQKSTSSITHHKYPDHHKFTLKNITKLADEFATCQAQKKLIITTEKDAQRLGKQDLLPLVNRLPILVIPIGINFLNNGQQHFDKALINYVREYTKHNAIY